MRRMLAWNAHTVELAMVCSRSLSRPRHRRSQAKVLSTTLRRGRTLKLFAASDRSIDLDRPVAMVLERAAQLVACVAAVGKDVAQPRETMADGL